VVDTGYPALSKELPGGGWPLAALADVLVQQSGVGELRLLRPALGASAVGAIALVNPPYQPDGLGLAYIGLPLDRLMLVKGPTTADALWSVEQILRAGTCCSVVFWAQHVKDSSLRRLHLAAQSAETLFVMVRPLATAQDSSPAVLRLALRPTADGLIVDVVKRRGPAMAEPIAVSRLPCYQHDVKVRADPCRCLLKSRTRRSARRRRQSAGSACECSTSEGGHVCYSAQVEANYKKYVRMFGAHMDIDEFTRLYFERAEGRLKAKLAEGDG
jgi:hypothetical protein